MRILHLTTSFPLDSKNVAGVFILELAKSLHNNNVDIEVLAPHAHNSKTHEKLDGVKVRRLRYFFPTKWQNLCYGSGMPVNIKSSYLARLQLPVLGLNFLIYILLRGKKYDLIHAHWNFAGLAAIIAGKIRKVPVVINIHHGQNRQEINRLDKFIIEKADSIVCNSRFNKDQIIKYCKPKSCVVIPPGVDCSRFYPDNKSDCLNFTEDETLILAVGRLIELKGFKYLLEAVFRLKNKIDNFHLCLIGDGPEKNKLEKFVRDNNIKKNVSFLGNIPNKNIVSYFQRSHIFVMPSIINQEGDTEGLGVVLLEAMACGVPCIASNVGGISDIVHNDYNGFLVEPRDVSAIAEKIELLSSDVNKRKKIGEQARLFIEKEYDSNIKAGQLKDLYIKILNK